MAGSSSFESINLARDISIGGSAQIQGALVVQSTLAVTGGATFGGNVSAPKIVVDEIQFNSNLIIPRHIDTGDQLQA